MSDLNWTPSEPGTWTTESEEETRELAKQLVETLKFPWTVALAGPLGAGKTTFVQGVVEALNGNTNRVQSPTFTLINEYETKRGTLYHADLYRTDQSLQQETIGLEQHFNSGVLTLVEWADRWTGSWPEQASLVRLEHVDHNQRRLRWHPDIPDPIPPVDKTVENSP